MKIYTVYTKPNARNKPESAEFVPEAFSWKGFFLFYNFFWALSNKCWNLAIVLGVFYAAYFFSHAYLQEYKAITENLVRVGFIFFGLTANDFWRRSLEHRGYIFKDVVAAKNEDEAGYKYFSRKNA